MYWGPFDEMKRFRKEMDSMFEKVFGRDLNHLSKDVSFRRLSDNIIEKDNEIIIILDIPNVDKKDIIIKATEDSLEVKAQKKDEIKIQSKESMKYKRSYSSYHRMFSLPSKVDAEKIVSEYKNGMLKIVILKKGKKTLENKKQKKLLLQE